MKYTKEIIDKYIQDNNLTCKLLECSFHNTLDKATFVCGCGNTYITTLHKFLYRKKYQCNDCGEILRRKSESISLKTASKEFQKHNLTLLSNEINSCTERLLCINSQGYYGLKSYHSLKSGNTFDIVSKHNPYSIHNIKHYIDINNLSCDIESKEYKNAKSKLIFKCNCGNLYETTWQSFTTNHNDRCPVCTNKQSKYSLAVENYLKLRGLSYTKEYSFNDCKDNHVLLFDFAVDNNKQLILIEVDGETHYVPAWNGEIGFQNQLRRDNIKNEYCKNNNIKLIRIPYWEITDGTYISKIDKEMKTQ